MAIRVGLFRKGGWGRGSLDLGKHRLGVTKAFFKAPRAAADFSTSNVDTVDISIIGLADLGAVKSRPADEEMDKALRPVKAGNLHHVQQGALLFSGRH